MRSVSCPPGHPFTCLNLFYTARFQNALAFSYSSHINICYPCQSHSFRTVWSSVGLFHGGIKWSCCVAVPIEWLRLEDHPIPTMSPVSYQDPVWTPGLFEAQISNFQREFNKQTFTAMIMVPELTSLKPLKTCALKSTHCCRNPSYKGQFMQDFENSKHPKHNSQIVSPSPFLAC